MRLGSPGAWTAARPQASQDKGSEGPAHSAGSPLGAVYILNRERKASRQTECGERLNLTFPRLFTSDPLNGLCLSDRRLVF